VNIVALGGLGGLALAVASFVIGVIGLRAKRKDREVNELREAQDTNVALFRWRYRVSTLAAHRGWDMDPDWPPLPLEATAEYLRGKAKASDNRELEGLLDLVTKLTKGEPK
jgi:hypothetical protein